MKKSLFIAGLFTFALFQNIYATALPNSGYPLIFQNATQGVEEVVFTVTDLGDINNPHSFKIPSKQFDSQPTPLLPAPSILTLPFWHHDILVTARITESHDNNPNLEAVRCGGPDNGKFAYIQGMRFVAKLLTDPITKKHNFACQAASPIL